MAVGYRKRIRLLPFLHLNVSSRGLSLSIGGRGASVSTRGTTYVGRRGWFWRRER